MMTFLVLGFFAGSHIAAMVMMVVSSRRIERQLHAIFKQQSEQDPVASGLNRRMLELQQGRFAPAVRALNPGPTNSPEVNNR